MKTLLAMAGLGLAFVLSGVAFFQSQKVKRLQAEIVQAQRQAATIQEALTSQQEQAGAREEEVRRFREEVSELPRLRGQVASLQDQLGSLHARYEQATQAVAAVRMESGQGHVQATRGGHFTEEREISLASVPAAIQSFVQRQYPGATVREVIRIAEEEGVIYRMEGNTGNDRDWHAVFDEHGELLEQVLELSVHEVPELVRASLHEQVGADAAVTMEQVWEDGRTLYMGNTERDGQEMHMVFSEDGRLVRYETWVEEAEIEGFE